MRAVELAATCLIAGLLAAGHGSTQRIMAGCPSVVPPAVPVPVVGHFTRCDPARLGWAADGSLFWQAQEPLQEVRP